MHGPANIKSRISPVYVFLTIGDIAPSYGICKGSVFWKEPVGHMCLLLCDLHQPVRDIWSVTEQMSMEFGIQMYCNIFVNTFLILVKTVHLFGIVYKKM